ncbi:MAG TPA: SDR family NAD(P)-dependent oxidoreductase [Patescibacteria group bacterium]|nr:SDR family NAD(P)-dependent oxidoreductase [Patescibacteria group bacterium]
MASNKKKSVARVKKAAGRKLALVTGASSGIGLALAHEFVKNGFDLIIAAENDEIHTVAESISTFGGNAQAVQVDLATFEGVEELYEVVRAEGRPLAAAAINAGVGVNGDFVRDNKLEDEMNLISLNVLSSVHLSKRVLEDMVKNKEGRLLITASIAGLAPGPYMATYNASKAFLLSFAQALRIELEDTPVTVTALMPGATETGFFSRAEMAEDTELGQADKDNAVDVARDGFEAMMAGREKVIAHSGKAHLDALMERILPASVAARLEGASAKPGSAK